MPCQSAVLPSSPAASPAAGVGERAAQGSRGGQESNRRQQRWAGWQQRAAEPVREGGRGRQKLAGAEPDGSICGAAGRHRADWGIWRAADRHTPVPRLSVRAVSERPAGRRRKLCTIWPWPTLRRLASVKAPSSAAPPKDREAAVAIADTLRWAQGGSGAGSARAMRDTAMMHSPPRRRSCYVPIAVTAEWQPRAAVSASADWLAGWPRPPEHGAHVDQHGGRQAAQHRLLHALQQSRRGARTAGGRSCPAGRAAMRAQAAPIRSTHQCAHQSVNPAPRHAVGRVAALAAGPRQEPAAGARE